MNVNRNMGGIMSFSQDIVYWMGGGLKPQALIRQGYDVNHRPLR